MYSNILDHIIDKSIVEVPVIIVCVISPEVTQHSAINKH